MGRHRGIVVAGILVFSLCAAHALAAETTIYVAAKDSPAYAAAEAKAKSPGVFVETKLHKALDRVGELLNPKGAQTLRILVAAGDVASKAESGFWTIPDVENPEAALHLLGGYGDDFEKRDPLRAPSKLVTVDGRSGAILEFGNLSTIREVVISGFSFDAFPSNAYDQGASTLLRDTSRTIPLIKFKNVLTDHLVVADCVFLNGPHGAFDPHIRPMSANTVVTIANNLFLNNVKTIEVGYGTSFRGNVTKRVEVTGNTFLMNWPYNPEPTSSLVSAVNLNTKDSAQEIVFARNIFALNMGGALQHDSPENAMPKLTLRENLFFRNAMLFGNEEPGAGAVVGKFGTSPKYRVLTLESLADDFGYTVEGNVVLDPDFSAKAVLATEADGDDLKVEGFAPPMKYDPANPPLPATGEAKGYGIQPGTCWSK